MHPNSAALWHYLLWNVSRSTKGLGFQGNCNCRSDQCVLTVCRAGGGDPRAPPSLQGREASSERAGVFLGKCVFRSSEFFCLFWFGIFFFLEKEYHYIAQAGLEVCTGRMLLPQPP